MKRLICLFLGITLAIVTLHAQDDDEESEKGFRKENLFTGGSITVSFFNGQTILGANPVFGYKLTDWADAGLAFNYIYNGARDYQVFNDKIRQTVIGPGAFVRLYPIPFLFVQGQFERNYSTLKYFPPNGGATEKNKAEANSLLLGGGFAQGREKGSTSFYYISVLFDVLKDINSPYINVTYNPDNPSQQRKTMQPIIRAGVNVGLFQGKYK
jgi:hypothetical protein